MTAILEWQPLLSYLLLLLFLLAPILDKNVSLLTLLPFFELLASLSLFLADVLFQCRRGGGVRSASFMSHHGYSIIVTGQGLGALFQSGSNSIWPASISFSYGSICL